MKKILITGANKGIGFETARQLAQLGNFVYLGSRDITNGQQAVDRLKATGINNVATVRIDVTNMATIREAKDILSVEIDALDVLINNAGIPGDLVQPLSTTDMEAIRHLFETNYFGAIQTTQAFLPLLKKSATPAIINVSSEVGSLTMQTSPDRRANWDHYAVYGATKTALNGFTVMLANELRQQNITVNSVTPGYTATDLNQFQGFKTIEEGARPIVALAMLTDRSVTGKFFKDGGEIPW